MKTIEPKQTAVEWLYESIDEYLLDNLDNQIDTNKLIAKIRALKQDAKHIEKEDLIEAFNEGALDGLQLGEQFYKFVYENN